MNSLSVNLRRGTRLAAVLLAAAWVAVHGIPALAQGEELEISIPDVVLGDVPVDVTIKDPGSTLEDGSPLQLTAGDRSWSATLQGGEAKFEQVLIPAGGANLTVTDQDGNALAAADKRVLPGWAAVLPALLAIAIALILRQVIPALFLGLWLGGTLVYGLSLSGLWHGLLDTVPRYILNALNDWGHLAVILFSLMIGGMVGIISKNGGTRGIVNAIIGWASSPKRGQISTGVLGVAIFFDDYANTLIVGNTMRAVTDRLRVSREKLAYLVDSTAAPVATIALVTTWIGFQVGLIDEAVRQIDGYQESAYSIFLNSIAYSFYPILAIFFVFLVAAGGRDFGPMLKAERRARGGDVSRPGAYVGESVEEAQEREPKPDKPQRALNAVIPVLVLVFGTFVGIYVTGAEGLADDASLRQIIGNGDSYQAMMWASLLAVIVAAVMSIGQRILGLGEVIDAWYAGVRSMLLAIIILILAWALSGVNETLHTGDYLVSTLGESLSPGIVPTLVFVLSAFTAFATGSSWGVMGIMMPLVIPVSWAVMSTSGLAEGGEHLYILYASVSAVLAGAVWGDHCSPISDTTILSSLASGCDHIDHVRTQIPYAVLVGGVAVIVGLLPVGFGLPWWVALVACAAILVVAMRYFGQPVDEESRHSSEADATTRTERA